MSVLAAPTDTGGYVITPVDTTSEMRLSANDISQLLLAHDGILVIEVDTPPSTATIKLRSTDFLSVRITTTAQYHVTAD